MRYRYLYIYVEKGGREVTVENEDQSHDKNWAWIPKTFWVPAKEGLSFYFQPVEERAMRLGYIRIPEEHYLFNYGVLDRTQYVRDKPFTAEHYTALYKFINKCIAEAGIPTSFEESMKY